MIYIFYQNKALRAYFMKMNLLIELYSLKGFPKTLLIKYLTYNLSFPSSCYQGVEAKWIKVRQVVTH